MCKFFCLSLSLCERDNVLMPQRIHELLILSAEDRGMF